MKLEIEKDRVLEAAKKCNTAEDILKTLFPKAFEEEIYKIGTYFVVENSVLETSEVYILTIEPVAGEVEPAIGKALLVKTTGKALLINIRTGSRFSPGEKVENIAHITYNELKKFFPPSPTKYSHYKVRKIPRTFLVEKESYLLFLLKSDTETKAINLYK